MLEIEYLEPNKEYKKMKKFFQEFKKFIAKGNVLDLAIAVVIGNAFNKIISSLVSDIIMPLVGIIIGGINLTGIKVTLGSSTLYLGQFAQNVIDFLIIAFSIFLVIKVFNKLSHKKEEEKKTEVKKSDEIPLLEEIRDLLKENQKSKKNEK